VLIPDGESFFALSVINCLHLAKKNIEIHVIYTSNELNGVQYSNKINSYKFYKKTKDNLDFIYFISDELVKRQIDVLLPLHHDTIRLVAANRFVFQQINCAVLGSNLNVFESVGNKWELSKYLIQNQISTPKTINSFEDISRLDFPILYKPASGTAGGQGIELIKSLNDITQDLINSENYILQEYVKGYDVGCNVLCLNGEILAFTTQKEIISSSTRFQAADAIEFFYDPILLKAMKKLFKSLNWTGVANVDLRFDEINNNYKLIEINPRFWGSVEGSQRVGVNFPYLYCLTALGIQFDLPKYRFETYGNNRSLFKIFISKFQIKKSKRLVVPSNLSIYGDLKDPLPKIMKYAYKI